MNKAEEVPCARLVQAQSPRYQAWAAWVARQEFGRCTPGEAVAFNAGYDAGAKQTI